MLKYPDYIAKLISFLKKLPGIGFKSAEKIAFELLDWDPAQVEAMGLAIQEFSTSHATCPDCFCLKANKTTPCDFCSESRDSSSLCIVATPKDVSITMSALGISDVMALSSHTFPLMSEDTRELF